MLQLHAIHVLLADMALEDPVLQHTTSMQFKRCACVSLCGGVDSDVCGLHA
jgi:hypothetical protein